jgi:hypothetical protein
MIRETGVCEATRLELLLDNVGHNDRGPCLAANLSSVMSSLCKLSVSRRLQVQSTEAQEVLDPLFAF